MVPLLAANAGDNFRHQLTKGPLVSAPHLARFVYDFDQSAFPAAAPLGDFPPLPLARRLRISPKRASRVIKGRSAYSTSDDRCRAAR